MYRYTTRSFCGVIGWLVVVHALYINPFAQFQEDASCETCLITQTDATELTHAVRADDGRVYDALALREWITRCRADRRVPCVIQGQPITHVVPVRTRRFFVAPHRKRMLDASTQTHQFPPKRQRRPPRVTIPSVASAFVPFVRVTVP